MQLVDHFKYPRDLHIDDPPFKEYLEDIGWENDRHVKCRRIAMGKGLLMC